MNFLTEIREGLVISWSAIRANKLRSILTTLGIIIGILTVTLMGTAITGLNNSFTNSISSIGADVLYVSRASWLINSQKEWIESQKRPAISLSLVNALERQLTFAQAVVPVAMNQEPVKYNKRNSSSVNVVGTTEQYQLTSGLTIAQGRFLSASESSGGRPVCVIGADVATNLFRSDPPLGEKIVVDSHAFEVVGVLEKQGGLGENGGIDNQVIVPLPQFNNAFLDEPDYQIEVKVRSLEQLDDAKEELRSVLRKIRHLKPGVPDNFAINQQDQFLELFHKVAGTIGAVGLFITGLSLFVGGIGIMNIMFVSVAERTREIGVRKAIGAKRRTILLQFLIEAAVICLIGGAIALGIAWVAVLALQTVMPAQMSPMIIAISLFVSLLTGVLSGFFPAWRAARMNPVDALRNE
ncbi:MAG: ABC transporter permease [Limisphaerales bacterium]